MVLDTIFNTVELHRTDKFVALRFLAPHRVISTSLTDGGIVEGLDVVFNHQGSEAGPLSRHPAPGIIARQDLYAAAMLERHGMAGLKAAQLGTAANMNNLAVVREDFREISVLAVATGGVEGNAARAGDPASCYEYDGRHDPITRQPPPAFGTINVMVIINQPMLNGALVRAVMTASEAKTAALQELSIPSRYSTELATGTGTDQIAICVPVCGPTTPLRGAGHHTTAGELIGKAVKRAIKDTLIFQNGLFPAERCSCMRLMERFGFPGESLVDAVLPYVPHSVRDGVRKGPHVFDRDPMTALAVAAFVHVHDQLTWGMAPPLCGRDAAVTHGASISAACSGRADRWAAYRDRIAKDCETQKRYDPAFVVPIALGLGYTEKWLAHDAMLADLATHVAPNAAGK
ncbi:MAG: adenosylcobinamide amidohydrolase [Rhodospirillaceae bacterium]|nr:adenosylcobinamide amidohydrolase [Rhodospirillaceae bacterium]